MEIIDIISLLVVPLSGVVAYIFNFIRRINDKLQHLELQVAPLKSEHIMLMARLDRVESKIDKLIELYSSRN